jgi:archaellum component FlaF (FlaF/FlaG flagellin family)
MKKLLSRRPSAGAVIGFIALCVALGGGAYAATKKKVEYKGLSKDARLKVLGVSETNAQTGTTPCDPNSSSTHTKCTSVDVNGSTGFPRSYLVIADGTVDGGGVTASGVCRLEVDGNEINGTKTNVHVQGPGTANFGINISTIPQGGKHTFSLACSQTAGDLKVPQFQLSAVQVR